MATISSKIPGLDIWAYDYSRRPVKELDNNGNPQLTYLNKPNAENTYVAPVTKNPTEFTNKPVNAFRLLCDIHHHFNGTSVWSHGIQVANNSAIDIQNKTFQYYSSVLIDNLIFSSDDMYISSQVNVLDPDSKESFTTSTPGINILNQTGIIQGNRGNSLIAFEVLPGYTIPVGNTIKITPIVDNDYGTGTTTGTPQLYTLAYPMTPGIYEIIAHNAGYSDWLKADIDFATKKDVVQIPHSKITFELSNCTVSPNNTDVENGTYSWTFTADNGYVFDNPGGIVNPNTEEIGDEIPATGTNVTHLNNYNVKYDTTIHLTADKQTTANIPIVQKLTHAKSNVSSASISRKLNAINLTADAGYTFQSSIQVLFYYGGKVVSDYNVPGNNKDTITIPLNTTKENTITENIDDIQLTAIATLNEAHTGYEHNYLITNVELGAFSKEQIWNYVGSSDSEVMYDASQYINNLIELPFKVDTTTSVHTISVGRIQSSVVAHEAKSRFVTLDLGTIKAPYKYNNAYDYQTQTIKLFTPFVSPITIDPTNAINQPIHIIYKIDLSNGNLTVNLYNDDVLFFTGINNVASELPFLNTTKNTIINRDTHFNDNDVRQPYLVITREEPILNSDYYPTIERGLIKNYNGNVKVRLLNNMNIPNNELSELTGQLESGVKYVKSN